MAKYAHPYTPYETQIKFMDDLYEALSTKKIGIFESPTGTGKTLSLLCPSVSWLRDFSQRQLDEELKQIEASGGPQWLITNAKQMRIAEFNAEREAHTLLIEAAKKDAVSNRSDLTNEPPVKRRVTNRSSAPSKDPLNAYLLEDEDALVDSALNLIAQATNEDGLDTSLEPLTTPKKIYFASRTHSQLSQIAEALRTLKLSEPVRFIALASRKQLCIHPEVTKLNSMNQMNEKCADLQKHSACSFRHNTQVVRNHALGEIMDIEDLAEYGKSHNSCPYYAARDAVKYAEVVALPYPMLLTRRNREALGINLTDSVVIIDEAHNLIDAITSLHSATLSQAVVNRALQGLQNYLAKLGPKLSLSNRRKVLQIVQVIKTLSLYFASLDPKTKPGSPVDKRKLFEKGNVDTLNIPQLNEFVRTSKLVYKVDSYLQDSNQANGEEGAAESSGTSSNSTSLGTVMDFVMVATGPTAEGKLFHDIVDDGMGKRVITLQYLVLDASSSFQDLVDQSSTIVMAGGTMEPVSDFTTQLIPQLPASEIAQRTYGHIIPRSQLLVMPLSKLRFTFAMRNDSKVIAELGQLFLKIISEVPNGVVAFFPGYNYLAHVVQVWKDSGILQQLESKKRVFAESSAKPQNLFAKYSGHAASACGALLLAVVGGKLSEGINFSDALARAVIMVGLPFPNAFSAEMVAKRDYIEKQALQIQKKSSQEATEESRQYYENLAMRSVNQSVGRAIRHIKDYAAIYLIDERYKTPRVQSKLSKWVRDNIEAGDEEDIQRRTKDFFAAQSH